MSQMEAVKNKIRFRNHISIVLEQMVRTLIVIGVIMVSGITQNVNILMDFDISAITGEDVKSLLIIFGAAVGLLVIGIAWRLLVWSRTFISVCDNTIVVERNTLNRKKNTIGIKNISNVNLEQNLFEMLIGTSKLKLDTNSMSTADKTDVQIILKKADAVAFRTYLMEIMRQEAGGARVERELESGEEVGQMIYDVRADFPDIIRHGIFSVNLFSLLVVVGGAVGFVEVISDILEQGIAVRSIVGVLAGIVVAASFFFTALWDILKGFIKYYDFRVKRAGDRLYIRYGLFRKVQYTVPVDKINGLKLNQTLVSRIAGRYMAEIINVGMGDDASEQQSFLLLYCKKKVLEEQLRKLLPEFADAVQIPMSRQPGTAWAAWGFSILAYAAAAIVTIVAARLYFPEYQVWLLIGVAGISIVIAICMVLWFITAGYGAGERYVALISGYLGRRFLYISYERIQYIELKQNLLAKLAGIQKGSIYLLASAANRTHALPYFYEKEVDILKERVL